MDNVRDEEVELRGCEFDKNERLAIDIEIDTETRLKRNNKDERKAYRHRFLHTACVCFSMFALGWRNALVGPTFPDLRLIVDEDLSTASWIFTAISFGGLIGSVCGGMAYDRFNKTFVFVFIMCGLGIVASVTPWCSHFVAMFIIHVFHGAFASALDTTATADVTVIWRHKAGPFMQAIHGTFSVGAIISPFICEPFLAKKLPIQDLNITLKPELTTTVSPYDYSVTVENTLMNKSNSDDQVAVAELDRNFNDKFPSLRVTYGRTYIYIPYLIATFVCVVAVSLYIILSLLLGNVYAKSTITPVSGNKNAQERKYFLSKRMKILFTVLVALSLATYVMGERCFTGFLMTFIITKVGWNKAQGSQATSTFWVAFAAGRLSGIMIVKCLRLSLVILVFFSLITAGAVLLWSAVVYENNPLVWVSIAVVGYGMSVIFASMFSWLSENIRRLTGKMASILFIFLSIGAMLIPILEGYLMDKVSQMWFVYSLLILSIIMIIVFIIVIVLFNILQKMHEQSLETLK